MLFAVLFAIESTVYSKVANALHSKPLGKAKSNLLWLLELPDNTTPEKINEAYSSKIIEWNAEVSKAKNEIEELTRTSELIKNLDSNSAVELDQLAKFIKDKLAITDKFNWNSNIEVHPSSKELEAIQHYMEKVWNKKVLVSVEDVNAIRKIKHSSAMIKRVYDRLLRLKRDYFEVYQTNNFLHDLITDIESSIGWNKRSIAYEIEDKIDVELPMSFTESDLSIVKDPQFRAKLVQKYKIGTSLESMVNVLRDSDFKRDHIRIKLVSILESTVGAAEKTKLYSMSVPELLNVGKSYPGIQQQIDAVIHEKNQFLNKLTSYWVVG